MYANFTPIQLYDTPLYTGPYFYIDSTMGFGMCYNLPYVCLSRTLIAAASENDI